MLLEVELLAEFDIDEEEADEGGEDEGGVLGAHETRLDSTGPVVKCNGEW